MSATAVNQRLAALTAAGVSVWLDQIRRSLIEGGELQRMVTEESLRGVTSNPSIFEKAILGSSDYDDELRQLAGEQLDARAIYDRLAIRDVQLGADVLAGVYEQSGGRDGFVSLEVGPELAHDADQSIDAARTYWKALTRPNVMIKIPGTPEGTKAIEQAIYEGINVNVTLLFAVSAYEAVAEAYISALERRHAEGKSLDVNSVASFFVSRVDTNVDRKLADLGRPELAGKAALANARAAYRRFQQLFSGPRWEALEQAGAAVQRPLWASTGVKNPQYPDTMYVDGLIGAHTVNTMPMATLHAFADHGEVPGPTGEQDPAADLEALARGRHRPRPGHRRAARRWGEAVRGGDGPADHRNRGAPRGRPHRPAADDLGPRSRRNWPAPVAERVRRAVEEDVAPRIWRRDESLWGGPGVPEIEQPTGLADRGRHDARAGARAEGIRAAVRRRWVHRRGAARHGRLLARPGGDPALVRRRSPVACGCRCSTRPTPTRSSRCRNRSTLAKTLFIVSSKSGGTIETLSHYRHFSTLAEPKQFVVVTDPGSPLEQLAKDDGLRALLPEPA